MKYRLSRPRAHVKDCPVSLFDVPLARNLGCRQVATANRFSIFRLRFFQSSEMFLGDDEYVRRGLRVDIFKGKDVIVFVDFSRGNLATENAAKKAVRGLGHRWFTLEKR